MWYERALAERAEEKLLELSVLLVPHAEDPNQACRKVRNDLIEMTRLKKHGRRR